MNRFKERPRTGEAKEKSKSALLPRQAAHMMKEKYIKQLDQRPKKSENCSQQAPEQVERAGRWAADELAGWAVEQGRGLAKRQFAADQGEAQATPDPIPPEDAPTMEGGPGGQTALERPPTVPREHQGERSPTALKQRPQPDRTANPIKDRRTVEAHSADRQQPRPYRTDHAPRTGKVQRSSSAHPLRERPMAQGFKERTTARMPADVPRGRTGGVPRRTPTAGPEAVASKFRKQKSFKEHPRLELHSRGRSISSGAGTGRKAPASAKAAPALKRRRDLFKSSARSLVGKVNYFWGGKSYVIGWDSRWGTLQKVTSPGSSTSGTYRPYGLDCSGFLDWALRNAGLHSDGHWYIGRNLTAVSQADAMPGDFALYPDASHVGMIVGRNSAGKLLVCHCSYGMNNVVVTEFAASGFTDVGRQPLVPG